MAKAKKTVENVTPVENVNVENVAPVADVATPAADVVTPTPTPTPAANPATDKNATGIVLTVTPATDPAPADDPRPTADDDSDPDDDGDDDENTDGEKKQRKERAKIDVTPFPVAEIVRDRLSVLLPAVKAELGDVENANELASAKLFSLGHDIVIDLVNALQVKFEEYAPRAYKGKNPSNHWLLWENTRAASREVKNDLERELVKLYAVTEKAVFSLLDSSDLYTRQNARASIDNFIPFYMIGNTGNITVQINELDKAGVKTVYLESNNFNNPAVIMALMSKGYMLKGVENIPRRKYPGISKIYLAIDGLYKFEK